MFDFFKKRFDEVSVYYWANNSRQWALLKTSNYQLNGKTFTSGSLRFDNVYQITEYKEGDMVGRYDL